MNYRKYIAIILLFAIIVMGMYPLLFYYNLGYQAEGTRRLNEWWQIKEEYADRKGSPKIFLISGSNTMLGLDAERMEQELKMPVVNFGTHAGLSRYVLQRSQKSLHSGDIVILPLEYSMYEDNRMEEGYTAYIMGYDSDFFKEMPWLKKIEFIYKVPASMLLRYCWQRIKSPVHEDSDYDSKYLNQNGDLTNNYANKKLPEEVLVKKIPKQVFLQAEVPSKEAKSELRAFIGYCRQNNIRVYATWPSFLWHANRFNDKDEEAINNIETFYSQEGVTVLGKYSDFIYAPDLFYDTIYHLNDTGKERRTSEMINLLRKQEQFR